MKIHFIASYVPTQNLNYIAHVNFAARTNYSTRSFFQCKDCESMLKLSHVLPLSLERRLDLPKQSQTISWIIEFISQFTIQNIFVIIEIAVLLVHMRPTFMSAMLSHSLYASFDKKG